jgi:hypothetical protein
VADTLDRADLVARVKGVVAAAAATSSLGAEERSYQLVDHGSSFRRSSCYKAG